MPESDWRSSHAYAFLNDAEAADFAWEFLRRNEKYREDHRNLQSEAPSPLSWHFRQRWGLSFRG
jgi:hypothetical protein